MSDSKMPERPYGSDVLTYDEYLKIPEICALQFPQSDPVHHDELLFIVIHQAYELWFKLILHELEAAMQLMLQGEALKAHHFTSRVVEVMKLLVKQIHILETMKPADFLEFRDRINPASGFQSSQFRELEFMAGIKDERYISYFKNRPDVEARLQKRLKGLDLKQAYVKMLEALGHLKSGDHSDEAVVKALVPIYENSAVHLPLYLLSESLVDFDEYLGFWREHHVTVVERIIGAFRRGTGGSSGVGYLKSTTSKRAFPFLWEVRSHLEKRS